MTPNGSTEPPALDQTTRNLRRAGLDLGRSTARVAVALRTLVTADLALARRALVRALLLTTAALLLGLTAWGLLIATLVAGLRELGLAPWLAALLPAIGALLATLGVALLARHRLADTRLAATRRQLARLRRRASEQSHAPRAGSAP